MSNVMVKEYYGTSTPEGMDVDPGAQQLAMLVVFAALQDKYGVPHRFQFSEGQSAHAGTREWRELSSKDANKWRRFKVCRREIDAFEHMTAFDFWVHLMGGDPRMWRHRFRTFNNDGKAKDRLENAARKLWERDVQAYALGQKKGRERWTGC